MVSAIYRRVVSRVPPAPCNLQNGTAFSIFANFGICNLRQPRGFARTIGTFRPSPTLCQRQPPTGLFLPLLGSSSESDTPTKRPKRPRRLDPSPPIDLKQFSVLLQNEGFTEVQAEALIGLVSEAITESLKNVSTTLATHSDQEASLSENDREFLRLQKDIQDLGKKDLAVLKSDLDRIVKDAERLKASMKDDVSRAHGGVRLDINLEKARIKDEAAILLQMVADAEARVDKEIETLATRMDNIKSSTRSSLVKFFVAAFTAFTLFKVGAWAHYLWKQSDYFQEHFAEKKVQLPRPPDGDSSP